MLKDYLTLSRSRRIICNGWFMEMRDLFRCKYFNQHFAHHKKKEKFYDFLIISLPTLKLPQLFPCSRIVVQNAFQYETVAFLFRYDIISYLFMKHCGAQADC